ncbi:MAG: FecR domain-containing protein, partial [Planctomycetes bacterium]|nr:FecR domain-containing protein [Planctomycetota bacterium]
MSVVPPDYDRLLQEYVEGSLDPDGRARLTELLAQADLRQAFARDVHNAVLVSSALRGHDASAFASRLSYLLDRQRPSKRAHTIAGIHRGLATRYRVRRWLGGAAAMAAAAMIVLAVCWSHLRVDPALPTMTMVTMDTGSTTTIARVHDGQQVTVPAGSSASARYDDGSALAIDGGSELAFSSTAGAKRISVQSGALRAIINKQQAPLVVVTPQAEVTVFGTVFALVVDTRATRIVMEAGEVRMTRLADHASIAVASGFTCETGTGADLPLVAKRTAPSEPDPMVGDAVGVVSGILVRCDRTQDLSSPEAWQRLVAASGARDEQVAQLIWSTVRAHLWLDRAPPIAVGAGEPDDPFEMFNAYGYGSTAMTAAATEGLAR